MTDCHTELVGLVLLSVALLISLCLNVILYIRRRDIDTYECCFPHINEGESPSQDEGQYFHNPNHREQQENPIYGNISSDRPGSVEVCYEMMTMQHTRDHMQPLEQNLNYASLDLKLAMKHKKKHCRQQGHTQGRNKLQEQLPVHLTPPGSAFSEVEADIDAHLPSKDTSTMVSHSSIYLNSQQIAQETEEMERERGISMERESVGWEGIWEEDGQSTVWKVEQESEERKDRQDCSNGSVRTQLPEAIQSGTHHFIRSFSRDSVQQD